MLVEQLFNIHKDLTSRFWSKDWLVLFEEKKLIKTLIRFYVKWVFMILFIPFNCVQLRK